MNQLWGRDSSSYDRLCVLSLQPKNIDVFSNDFITHLNLCAKKNPDDNSQLIYKSKEIDFFGRFLDSGESINVTRMWNIQNGEDQARCHIPHHALATYKNGNFDWLASICFICSNVYIYGSSAMQRHRIILGGDKKTKFNRYLDELLSI